MALDNFKFCSITMLGKRSFIYTQFLSFWRSNFKSKRPLSLPTSYPTNRLRTPWSPDVSVCLCVGECAQERERGWETWCFVHMLSYENFLSFRSHEGETSFYNSIFFFSYSSLLIHLTTLYQLNLGVCKKLTNRKNHFKLIEPMQKFQFGSVLVLLYKKPKISVRFSVANSNTPNWPNRTEIY